jgi:hypothetical protein
MLTEADLRIILIIRIALLNFLVRRVVVNRRACGMLAVPLGIILLCPVADPAIRICALLARVRYTAPRMRPTIDIVALGE